MRTLVFGKFGQVAWELRRSLAVLGDLHVAGREQVDFLSADSIVKVLREYKPTHIVNAAAYTAVDKAETEVQSANQINGQSVGVIAEEALKLGACLLHYSTDYVFDGAKGAPYVETDLPSPLNVYGNSKLLGEKLIQEVGGNHIILRVSWVYGARGANFYRTMLRLGESNDELRVVSDQVGAPTWSRHIADASAQILRDSRLNEKSGVYHLSPQGEISWHGFAEKIFELQRSLHPDVPLKVKSIKKITTSEYPTLAKRPLNSRMSSAKVRSVFGLELPFWDRSLELVLVEKSR